MRDSNGNPPAPSNALRAAADVLVRAPVRGRPHDRFVAANDTFLVIADADSMEIAHAIAEAAVRLGAHAEIVRLDDRASLPPGARSARPRKTLPSSVRQALARAHSVAYVASAPSKERPMREGLSGLVATLKMHYAYLPDINLRTFVNGLPLDHAVVARTGRSVVPMLEGGRTLVTDSPAGTKLVLKVLPGGNWIPRLGEIVPGKGVAFPAGSLYAAIEDAQGTFVADASVGEFFGAREGLLREKPVRLTIERGRVVRVETSAADLQRDIEATLSVSSNSNRVGLVAVGVNEGLRAAIGDAAVDHNMPGLHLFLGDPASRATGASWNARTSFAACQTAGSLKVDGRPLAVAGRITEH